MIRAVWVPEGGALPGYPYEHIGHAVFIPDSDDHSTSAATSRRNAPRMSPSRAASTDDQRVQEDNALDDWWRPGSGLASQARPWAPATNPTASGGSAPRRGVRSAQANFGAAVPTPYLDTSRDAIDAAVGALSMRPTNWDYARTTSLAALATRPGISLPPLQSFTDSVRAATDDPVVRSDAQPSRLVSDAAQGQRPTTADITSPPSDPGVAIILPNGSALPDPSLRHRSFDVTRSRSRACRSRRSPCPTHLPSAASQSKTRIGALPYLGIEALINVGHGGRIDYQRRGNYLTGFTQFRQYRDAADFNVGLFCQQAGLSVEETLIAAGQFAHVLFQQR
jgi:hypothetical protein